MRAAHFAKSKADFPASAPAGAAPLRNA